MNYQDLKIGDIVHMEYFDGDETFQLYSCIIDMKDNAFVFSDLYCDKGLVFKDTGYSIRFPDPSFKLIAIVGHHLPIDFYFQSLFPELTI